jgi:hypothetical protein
MTMGLLLAALGGASEVGLSQIREQRQSDLELAHAERMAQMNSDLALKRTQTIESMRRGIEVELHQSKQQRLSDQTSIIEAEAADNRTATDVSTANLVAPSVDGAVMGFIKTTLPAGKVKEVYGVQESTPVSQLDDQIGVARQHGFYESETGLRADRRAAASELNADRLSNDREKRTVLIEQRDEDNRLAADKRLERIGQGGGSEPSFVATYKFLLSKGYSKERIEEILTQKKAISTGELAAKLAGKDKSDGGGKQPRRSLDGDAAHMDAQGNVRDATGNIIFQAKRKPGMQPLDNAPPSTQADVDAFNATMAAKSKPEPSLIDRLFNLRGAK